MFTIARRLMEHVAAVWEAEGSDYLDPALAALCEAFFFSRNPPLATRVSTLLPGMEGETGGEENLRGKPLCASIEGFSLHAAQGVAAQDREALERLLRYGLRAPFSQERLALREDGKVVYLLRRPWPNARGATHLLLDPLDLLRRLAALVSFPYSHQVRYHGVFAGRSRMRRLLPPPPQRQDVVATEGAPPPSTSLDAGEGPTPQTANDGPSPAPRCRMPWAQLLRRVMHIDALSCPKCSTQHRTVPMIVLAFLTDPAVIERILRHLGLPHVAPGLAPARSSPWQAALDPFLAPLREEIAVSAVEERAPADPPDEAGDGSGGLSPPIRPPP